MGLDELSKIVLVFANLLGFLICLFSKDYLHNKKIFFSYFVWLLAFSNLEILACDFVLFIFSWGISLVLLYALLNIGSAYSGRKALTILGVSYFCFILGVSLYVFASGSLLMPIGNKVSLNNPLVWASFMLMSAGALAKSGCGPFHTWIPTAAESAPIPVMAILPAALDKLLGIYILARICLDFFAFNAVMIAILLLVGSLTIMFAVMMALVQHDLRKLLSYHAISQVGYMVLGIGTANPVGIAGAIFHMFNNSLYKSGLFLAGGAVENKRHTFELGSLGGLAKFMPLTFICSLVFALSISGIPPLNGFASKWMLYQGVIIGFLGTNNQALRAVYMFALITAMFGSALTLASFIKFIHAIFLGQNNSPDKKAVRESSWPMLAPLIVLALFCVGLGVFSDIFIKRYLSQWIPDAALAIGNWNSLFVFIFFSAALILGLIIWAGLKHKQLRQDTYFIGAETTNLDPSFPGTEFYKTIEEMPRLKRIYRLLKDERFDLYNILVYITDKFAYIVAAIPLKLIKKINRKKDALS